MYLEKKFYVDGDEVEFIKKSTSQGVQVSMYKEITGSDHIRTYIAVGDIVVGNQIIQYEGAELQAGFADVPAWRVETRYFIGDTEVKQFGRTGPVDIYTPVKNNEPSSQTLYFELAGEVIFVQELFMAYLERVPRVEMKVLSGLA